MRLLLLGCSGFVGRELVPLLRSRGHHLTLVSRREAPFPSCGEEGLRCLRADPSRPGSWGEPALADALAAAEGVVNLAGEPIAEKRWTPGQRELLRSSRLGTTRALVEAMKALETPSSVLVSASAIGYYGTSEESRFTERSPAGDDFLAGLCRDWEEAALAAPEGVRVVRVRIGIVLGPDGGALARMLPVFRAGLGGPIGSGRQWMSWIHREDLCRLIATALEDPSWSGVVNAVAPRPVRMREFAASLGRVLGRPSLLPVPAPVLQLLLGDGAGVVLEGQQVIPERLEQLGFRFTHPELSSALAAATTPAPR